MELKKPQSSKGRGFPWCHPNCLC